MKPQSYVNTKTKTGNDIKKGRFYNKLVMVAMTPLLLEAKWSILKK